MTLPSDTSALSVSDARDLLRGAKLKSTTSRVAVLQHLAGAGKPLSHAEVAEALVPAGFDKSTLYRCLVELADSSLLARLDAGDHAWRFELRRSAGASSDEHGGAEHPHFICLDCGKVECLEEVEVKISPAKGAKTPLLADVTEVFLKGHCNECR